MYIKEATGLKFFIDLSGAQGIQGPVGPKGDKGDAFKYTDFTAAQIQNLKGPKGDTGLTGPQGPRGEQGLTGPTGPQGPIGRAFTYSDFTQEQLNGLRGPQGIQGAQGIQGQKGEKGERGDQGLSPNFAFTLEDNGDLFVDINYTSSPATPNTTSAVIKTYDVVWGIAQAGAPGPIRGYLEYSALSGFGKLHLDMKVTGNGSGNGGVLCTLPNDAPVPTRLLETSIDASNNSVYIDPNSREVKGWGVAGNNKRYILDLVGFWKETK